MNPLFEEIFLKCFGSKERLMQYIAQDIDLAQYVKNRYSMWIALAVGFLSNRSNLLNELKSITKQDILDLLKRKRPDLYQVLQTEEGKRWFQKQNFSKFFQF